MKINEITVKGTMLINCTDNQSHVLFCFFKAMWRGTETILSNDLICFWNKLTNTDKYLIDKYIMKVCTYLPAVEW